MPDIQDLLRQKELQLQELKREVEALRLVAPLLAEVSDELRKPPQGVDQIVWKDAATGLPVKAWP